MKDDNAIEKSKNEISFLQAKSEFDSMRSEQISDNLFLQGVFLLLLRAVKKRSYGALF